jgi:hypothetical protein
MRLKKERHIQKQVEVKDPIFDLLLIVLIDGKDHLHF